MIFQVGDMLKYDNKYDPEIKAVAIVMKVYDGYDAQIDSGKIRTYDLLYLSKNWQGEGRESEDLAKGYRHWQIEDGSWRKIG